MHLLLVGFPEDSYLRVQADVSLIAFPFYNNLPWPRSKRGSSNLEVLLRHLRARSAPFVLAGKELPSRAITNLYIPVKLTKGIYLFGAGEGEKAKNNIQLNQSLSHNNEIQRSHKGAFICNLLQAENS